MTWVMIACIVASLVAIIVAMAILGRTAYRLYKQIQAVQAQVMPIVDDLMTKQEALLALADKLATNQVELAEAMARASAAIARLQYLLDQLTRARRRLVTFSFLSPV